MEQLANAVTFYAFYVESKVGKTGLTVTCDVWELTQAGAATEIVTGGSAVEVGDGLYKYVLASGSVDAVGEYVAVFKTATTSVDARDIPALWIVGRGGNENLDAAISTRNATTPPTVDAIADQVWDEALGGHAVAGSAGAALTTAGSVTTPPTASAIADQVWDEALSGHVVAGSAGAALTTASSADPLLNAVPGSYASGTAGAALGRIGSLAIEITSPVVTVNNVTIVAGDDYLAVDGRALTFTAEDWPTLTDADVTMLVETHAGTVAFTATVTGAHAFYVEMTAAETAELAAGHFNYDLRATLANDSTFVLAAGTLLVARSIAAAPVTP